MRNMGLEDMIGRPGLDFRANKGGSGGEGKAEAYQKVVGAHKEQLTATSHMTEALQKAVDVELNSEDIRRAQTLASDQLRQTAAPPAKSA